MHRDRKLCSSLIVVTVTNKKNSVTSDQVDKLPNEIFIKSEDIKLGKLVGEGKCIVGNKLAR